MKDPILFSHSRRRFIADVSKSFALTMLSANGLSTLASCGGQTRSSRKEETAKKENNSRKLGIALVGLGGYSSGQLAPALQETKNCYLAGIVTGTPAKAGQWKAKYDIPEKNIYNYGNFDSIKNNPDIDIVYIVLPNGMHAEYSIRAANAGKHVICEKPMAITVEECDRMIAASKKAGKMLSIGYRLHFEPYNKEMMRLGQQKVFGNLRTLKAENGFVGGRGWRLDKELAGGGPLMDVGIYCVQGVRYTTGMEPVAVTAREGVKTNPDKFREVEESLHWQMEFPGGITADCFTSYAHNASLLRAEAERGWFEITPAYYYNGQQGRTSNGEMNFPHINQQAAQMDDFADAIRNNRPTPVPGEMGRQDVKILQAIYEAMRTGNKVNIG